MTGRTGHDRMVQVGRIARSHGVRGGFYVDDASDPSLFEPGCELWLDGHPHSVITRAGTPARPIVRVSGIETPEAIKDLIGKPVEVPAPELPPLEEGEWYANDLIGLTVVDTDAGESAPALGEVVALINAPSVDLLEVRPADGATFLLPMNKDAIDSIDPAARRIAVHGSFLSL